jgi:hypothetical protein
MSRKYILLLLPAFFIPYSLTEASYGDGCDQYGPMAYSDGGYCKCVAGYVFDTGVTGSKYCTDANLICHNKLGYSSNYDYLSDSCKCSYGYVIGKDSIGRTQCVSPDSLCTDQLGVMSQYDSVTDTCKCLAGYVISGGQCTYGNSVCRAKSGLYSRYNSSSNKCECDSGYTLDATDQCVKKQNNVYFKLLDVNTDTRQAIIKSEYDYSQYLITYGSGCYDSSINRYRNQDLVVNLGTDFDLDTWDEIVLQNDNETCSITQRERTYDDSLAPTEVAPTPTYYVPPPQTAKPAHITPVPAPVPKTPTPQKQSSWSPVLKFDQATSSAGTSAVTSGLAPTTTSKKSLWRKFLDWFKWW